jgi:uncharacterized protein
MAEQPIVTVRGEANREVPPEQAVFSVAASARDQDRDTVLTRIAERTAAVQAVVDAHPVERRETGMVQVYPELKRGSEKVVAYTASVVTTVTVTEFAGLGEFLLQLARLDYVAVSGPWWQLRRGSRAGADVRKAAVDDALLRAAEYAEAVGARVDRLLEIADEGLAQAIPAAAFSRSAVSRSAAAEAPPLEVDPRPQTVHAAVTVRVTITEPRLTPAAGDETP